MIYRLIHFSVKNKLIIGIVMLIWIAAGVYSLQRLPIDAVPDITNNQVQVVTIAPSLAAQEVEQFITYPVEVSMANIPNLVEIRSISRYGLSVVTIVFEDRVPVLEARQFVKEQIDQARAEIAPGLGTPELMPITTGLGEIYQYVLRTKPGYEDRYDAMELRTIQDWIVKRQLSGTPGIIEISSFGGLLKQYEVSVNPLELRALGVSIADVFTALERNNQNSGGSYIEKTSNAYYIRTEGIVKNIQDIEQIVVTTRRNLPILIRDVAKVTLGSPKRFGAMTMDGQGEAVGGITLMLKGGNSSEAIANVHKRIESVKESLPEGLEIYPYLDRSELVMKTIQTVTTNLVEGGLIVIFVLILLLGNWRAGLIVASIIPLAMLFAMILMNYFGLSANLMSLGAIDFGIVVDGAVIVVEGVLHALLTYHVGKKLTQSELDAVVIDNTAKLFRSTVFGVFIILVVFIPIMTLTGIEGKMFRPMSMTFSFAVLGALILSLTYVPMMAALVMPKNVVRKINISDHIVRFLRRLYRPVIERSLQYPAVVLASAIGLLVGTVLLFQSLGAVFIPTLEEGDLAMQMAIKPGSSLSESIRSSGKAEQVLLANYPEVQHVVSKIGTAEVPTDPMAIEDADIMIILDEKKNWTSAHSREELVEKMKKDLQVVAGATFEFTQPIQLRFNELMTGAKTDIAVKIFGENTELLKDLADEAAQIIARIDGAADVKVERTEGLPQLMVRYDRQKIAHYGLNIQELNTAVRTAYAGEVAGVVFEDERKFDLVVRFDAQSREEMLIERLFVPLANGATIPLSEVASVQYTEGPMQISRESARRFIGIGINVRNRDVASLVADIEQALNRELILPAGYSLSYGGEFENLRKAKQRLSIAVPAALALIFILLYFAFGKLKYALIIFTAVPLSAIGGVVALWIRGMPFSISAGVGFIALFGVAVLNGIVLISYFNRLRYEHGMTDLKQIIIEGGCTRLRPVVMTATVAALGFLPMALSTSNGAEVQKPLATVVIGGLVTATLLTLIVLPVLYMLVNRLRPQAIRQYATFLILLMVPAASLYSQDTVLTKQLALENALEQHSALHNAMLRIDQAALRSDQAKIIPPTALDLALGQINSDQLDYNFSIQQSLGNRAANRSRSNVAAMQKRQAETEYALTRHLIASELDLAWDTWMYRVARSKIITAIQNVHDTILAKSTWRYDAGEVSTLQVALASHQQTMGLKDLQTARLLQEEAWQIVVKKAMLDGAYGPMELPYLALPMPRDSAASGLWTDPLRERISVSKAETRLQDALRQPELSLGYFNQSIRPDYAFQGISAGVQIPLYAKHHKARKEEYLLEESLAQNALEMRMFQLRVDRDMAWKRLQLAWQQLNDHGATLAVQQEQILILSAEQWENGEIDYFAFLQSQKTALQGQLNRLDMMHAYNQAVLYWQKIR